MSDESEWMHFAIKLFEVLSDVLGVSISKVRIAVANLSSKRNAVTNIFVIIFRNFMMMVTQCVIVSKLSTGKSLYRTYFNFLKFSMLCTQKCNHEY